jgi:hypothetical protein
MIELQREFAKLGKPASLTFFGKAAAALFMKN